MISYESSYSILIGHRIRNERIALGMTQSEFAKLLGISPSYLGALERGTRPVTYLRKTDDTELGSHLGHGRKTRPMSAAR